MTVGRMDAAVEPPGMGSRRVMHREPDISPGYA